MSRPAHAVGPLALVVALALHVLAPAAHAGPLIDRAAQQLAGDNVYVDPAASPKISAGEAQRLRDRITSSGAAPMYVAVMPQRIVRETGGSAASALLGIGRRVGRSGTYVLVAGRHMDAAATGDVLPRGEATKLRDEAIKAGNGDLATILLGLTDRIGAARSISSPACAAGARTSSASATTRASGPTAWAGRLTRRPAPRPGGRAAAGRRRRASPAAWTAPWGRSGAP